MFLKSPASKRRMYDTSESRDCEYLELQPSPVGDDSKPDYVNVVGIESPNTPKAETVTDVKLEEGSYQTKISTVNTLHYPKSPAPSDDSDLPDYVNVCVSSSESHLPPPIPPRNK